MTQKNVITLLSYSPNLSFLDYFLFPKLKLYLWKTKDLIFQKFKPFVTV